MIVLIKLATYLETTLTRKELDEQLCLILEEPERGNIDYLDVEFEITEEKDNGRIANV